ncbi:hypothetical protein [Streptomyces phage phiScoe45]|uniref:Uncharacterized protein n=1 Tax=Streptomyces phage Joe TaxID=1913034 RepID=A0A1J0GP43_9CAUD|nr:hypothetical protein KGG94_gp68 [Streptomyces phage Joe]APC43308.1 hypothetical protein Joe_68 [Streptomyces phage Joe]WJN63243.1 hypothetical protein [Streptomyces phage phiScoe45]
MDHAEIAARNPEAAARVVIRAAELGGDVQNAWEVFADGVGYRLASQYLQAETDQADLIARQHNLVGYQL